MEKVGLVPCDTITVSGAGLWLAGCSNKMDLLTMVEHDNWLKPAMSLFGDDDLALLVWRRLCTYQSFGNITKLHTLPEGAGELNDDLKLENTIIDRYPRSWLPENYWHLPLLNDIAREDQRRGGEWEIKHTIGGGREQTTHKLLVPPGIGAAVHLKENLGMIPVFRYSTEPHTLYKWYHDGTLVFELWVTWEEFNLAERVMPTEFHEEKGYVEYVREGRRLEVTKYDSVRIGALNYEGTVDVDSPLLVEGDPGNSFSDSFVITSDDITEGLPKGVTIQSYAPYGVPIPGRERIFQRIKSFPGEYIETPMDDLLDIEDFSYLFAFEDPSGRGVAIADPSFSTTNKRRTRAIFHLGLHSTLPTYETLIKDLEWVIEEVRAHMSQLMFTQAITVPAHRDPRIHVALWVYVCDIVIIQSPQLTYVYAEKFQLHSPVRRIVDLTRLSNKERELLVTIARNLYRSEYGMSLVNVLQPEARRLLDNGLVQPLPLLDYDTDLPRLSNPVSQDDYAALIRRVFVDGVYGPNKDPGLDYGHDVPVSQVVYNEFVKNISRLSEVFYKFYEGDNTLDIVDLSEFGFVRWNVDKLPTIAVADVSGDTTRTVIRRGDRMYYNLVRFDKDTRYNKLGTLDEVKEYVDEVVSSDLRRLVIENALDIRKGYVDNPLNPGEMDNGVKEYNIAAEFPNIVYAMSRRREINNLWPWKEVNHQGGMLRVVSIPHSATGVTTVIKPHKGGILHALALCSVIDTFYHGILVQLKGIFIDSKSSAYNASQELKKSVRKISEMLPLPHIFSRAAHTVFSMMIEKPVTFTRDAFLSIMRTVLGNYGATLYDFFTSIGGFWTEFTNRLDDFLAQVKGFFNKRTSMLLDSDLIDSVVKTLCEMDHSANSRVTQCVYPDIMSGNMDPREANALEHLFMVNSCSVELASVDNGGKCVKRSIVGLGRKDVKKFNSTLIEYQGELYVLPPNNVSFKVHGRDGIMIEPTVALFDASLVLFSNALTQEYQPLFMNPGFNLTVPERVRGQGDRFDISEVYMAKKANGTSLNEELVDLLKSMMILGKHEGINQIIPNGSDASSEEFFDHAVYKPVLRDANIESVDWGHDVGGLGVVVIDGKRKFIYPLMVGIDIGGAFSIFACRQPVVGSVAWSYIPNTGSKVVLHGLTFERILDLLPVKRDEVRVIGLDIGTEQGQDMSATKRLQIKQTRRFVTTDYVSKARVGIVYRKDPARRSLVKASESF